MDPQHRLFLEQAWAALEHAGCDPETLSRAHRRVRRGRMNTYLLALLARHGPGAGDAAQNRIRSDKDFLATLASYKLNLRGPSLAVQTACSTSLVAVHLACQSLLDFQCDAALAGGVSLAVPLKARLPGRGRACSRATAAAAPSTPAATGTVGGSGVGVVVLKRLSDALARRRPRPRRHPGLGRQQRRRGRRWATRAPSVDGQIEVIALAHAVAGRPAGEHHLRGGARHGHAHGRPGGGGRAHPRVRHGGAGLLRPGLGQDQHRPPGRGGGRRQPDQDGAGAASTARSRRRCTSTRPTRASTSPTRPSSSPTGCCPGRRRRGRRGARACPRSAWAGPTRTWCWRRRPISPPRPAEAQAGAAGAFGAHARRRWTAWPRRRPRAWRAHPSSALADVAFTLQRGRRAFRTGGRWSRRPRRRPPRCCAAATPRGCDARAPRTRTPASPSSSPAWGRSTRGWGAGCTTRSPPSARRWTRCFAVLRDGWGMDLRAVLYRPPTRPPPARGGMDLRALLRGPAARRTTRCRARAGATRPCSPSATRWRRRGGAGGSSRARSPGTRWASTWRRASPACSRWRTR